jgi:anti-sigma-K factor RskA
MTGQDHIEPSELDALAAEYVMGTLDQTERSAVAARRGRDANLDAAIRAWEQRLAPLNDLVAPVAPPAAVWQKIQSQIGSASAPPSIAPAPDTNVVSLLERRVKRWRRIGITASALAASLLAVIGTREYTRTQAPQSFVAVFQKDDAAPAFLLSIDLNERRLSIQGVAAETPPGKSYQLWIAPDASGRPRSIGVLDDRKLTTQSVFETYDPNIVKAATFGVSLEPAGGSPTGLPTGPVFHAKLIPTPR